jgi:peptidoglycan/xylan/chitin deacetylase (PgdA/CDA1 family)
MKIRTGIKRVVGVILVCLCLFGLYQWWLYPQYTVPILMYHSVDESPESLSVSPEIFERQMYYLKSHRYHVISLDEFVEGKRKGRTFPHNTVVITFDDGFEDNYTAAYPSLKRYGFPATIFLIVDRIGTTFDEVTYLTWDQIKEMSRNGITFGSHTWRHTYVPDFSLEEFWLEAISSKKEIELQTGQPVRHFCYPSGGFTEGAKAILQRAGYRSAATTNRGLDRYQQDLYELKRVKVSDSDGVKPLHFRLKLSGYYYLFRRPKAGY